MTLLTTSKHLTSRVVYLERNELNNVHMKLLHPPSNLLFLELGDPFALRT